MSIELKIKAKHLALEPAIIRKEEKKLRAKIKYAENRGQTDNAAAEKYLKRLRNSLISLEMHRRQKGPNSLRGHARATHVARNYLAGKPFSACERPSDEPFPHLTEVYNMVRKYGYLSGYSQYKPDILHWITFPDSLPPRR